MRKRNKQSKLSRTTAHRKSLLRNLAQELILHKQIKTTLPKAKALRPFVEPLITKAKNNVSAAEKQLSSVFYNQEVVRILMDEIGPGYAKEKRDGGYTRIIKLGTRKGDSTEVALIQLVENGSAADNDKEESSDA